MIARAAIYVGEVLRRAWGQDWQLEDKPRFSEFGEFIVGHWNPKIAVHAALREKSGTKMRSLLSAVMGER